MATRRQFVIGGAVAAGAAVLYGSHAAGATRWITDTGADTTGPAPRTEPYTVRMPVPEVARPTWSNRTTDFYDMTVTESSEQLLPGVHTTISGYDGLFVGPTIRARHGREVVVRQTNRLDRPIATHLHGGHDRARDDGYPMDLVEPGGRRDYHYPNRQGAMTLWYHDHAHHDSAENVFKGLAGFYLIAQPEEYALDLPGGPYDVPIMLRDARIGDDGSLVFEMDDWEHRRTLLVNGRNLPYFPVRARRYRFRFLNAANLRPFVLALADSSEMVMVGADQGLLPKPNPVTSLEIWPGERYDVVVDFSRYRVGDTVELTNSWLFPGEGDAQKHVMRFDVVGTATDHSTVPPVLAEPPRLPAATRTRRIQFGPSDPVKGVTLIDGKTFDPNRVDQTVKLGSTEVWEIYNADVQYQVPHNFHIHLVRFKVLDRDGNPPPAAESGWRDTVTVHPGETVRVQATFDDYVGRFLYHCHLIDHADMGMMAQFEVVE